MVEYICADCLVSFSMERRPGPKPKVCAECKTSRDKLRAASRERRVVLEPTVSEKVCKECVICKPQSEFQRNSQSPDGLLLYCKDCISIRSKAWVKNKPADRAAEYATRKRAALSPDELIAKAAAKKARVRASRMRKVYARLDRQHAERKRLRDRASKPWLADGLTSADYFRIRYANDPEFRVSQLLKTSMRRKRRGREHVIAKTLRRSMKYGSDASAVESFLGYSASDLKTHLEAGFVDGMDWPAFMTGAIHIDHIRPVVSFDLTDDHQIRKCWSLDNLQPLWAADNMKKGAKWHPVADNDNDCIDMRVAA